jgi:hypothetical protein
MDQYNKACKKIMEARGVPSWVLEAYEVEKAVQLIYKLCANDLGVFKTLAGRLFDGVYSLGVKETDGEKYLDRLVAQVNHRRATEELRRRSNNGDKEAAEILNKENHHV